METGIRAPEATTTGTTPILLACGAVAGPLFVGVALLQVLTRDGFDLSRHPLSLLSLGDLGWVQIANFVVSGMLAIAFAVGSRRVLHPGRAGRWGPVLLGLYGVGLVAGGVFVADPGAGFPPGAPEGAPEQLSWHGALHAVAPPLAFLSLIVACLVVARRFTAAGERAWSRSSVATAAVCLGLLAWPDLDGLSWRLALALTIAWAWVSAVALKWLQRTQP
jgi:Protein of unknown function (DUF998)